MRNWNSHMILAVTLPLILTGCMPDNDRVVEPDKEPAQVEVQAKVADKPNSLTQLEVIDWYVDGKTLADYTTTLKEKGYEKPYKEILLAEGEAQTKKGLIYKVQDGFAMLEYDADTEYVLAITGYQTEEQFILQEMKTKAYSLESKRDAEQDPTKQAELQQEVDALWAEIAERES